jgi:transcription termination factor NusB
MTTSAISAQAQQLLNNYRFAYRNGAKSRLQFEDILAFAYSNGYTFENKLDAVEYLELLADGPLDTEDQLNVAISDCYSNHNNSQLGLTQVANILIENGLLKEFNTDAILNKIQSLTDDQAKGIFLSLRKSFYLALIDGIIEYIANLDTTLQTKYKLGGEILRETTGTLPDYVKTILVNPETRSYRMVNDNFAGYIVHDRNEIRTVVEDGGDVYYLKYLGGTFLKGYRLNTYNAAYKF